MSFPFPISHSSAHRPTSAQSSLPDQGRERAGERERAVTESGYGSGWYRMLSGWEAVEEQRPRERRRIGESENWQRWRDEMKSQRQGGLKKSLSQFIRLLELNLKEYFQTEILASIRVNIKFWKTQSSNTIRSRFPWKQSNIGRS